MRNIEKIKQSFEQLKNDGFFVSEADFQHKLGIELKKSFDKDADVVMEFPIKFKDINQNNKERIIYIDIMVVTRDKKLYPIELKYKTKQIKSDKPFKNTNIPTNEILKNQMATDLGCYSFWSDINRIETLIENNQVNCGVCIFLTNDLSYCKDCSEKNANKYQSVEFRIHNESKNKGLRSWQLTEHKKTMKRVGFTNTQILI